MRIILAVISCKGIRNRESIVQVEEAKRDAAIRGKKGVSFILAGTVIWIVITAIFLMPNLSLETKNIFMLVSTGMMFPLAVGISTLLKADWKLEDNPLNMLGLIINLAQFAYFPFIFWAFAKSPEQVVLFFAIITAAHFFPYGWYYESKAYYMIAPLVAVMITVVGWTLGASQLWLIPTVMVGSLIILATWVTVENREYATKNA